jgi:hypothetical protein
MAMATEMRMLRKLKNLGTRRCLNSIKKRKQFASFFLFKEYALLGWWCD